MFGFYINRSDLPAVLSCAKIGPGPIVRVIETQTGRTRSEHNPAHSVCGNKGRPFFGSAIDVSRNHLAVPMQLFGSVRFVVYFDRC